MTKHKSGLSATEGGVTLTAEDVLAWLMEVPAQEQENAVQAVALFAGLRDERVVLDRHPMIVALSLLHEADTLQRVAELAQTIQRYRNIAAKRQKPWESTGEDEEGE